MIVTLINATSYVSMATGKKYEKGVNYEVDEREGRTLLSARYMEKPFFRQIYDFEEEAKAPVEPAPKATKSGVKVVRKSKGVSPSASVNDDGELDTAANAIDV